MTGREPAQRRDPKPPVVTLVVLVLAAVAATVAACVGVVSGSWTPLGVAMIASLGAAIAAMFTDALLDRGGRP